MFFWAAEPNWQGRRKMGWGALMLPLLGRVGIGSQGGAFQICRGAANLKNHGGQQGVGDIYVWQPLRGRTKKMIRFSKSNPAARSGRMALNGKRLSA